MIRTILVLLTGLGLIAGLEMARAQAEDQPKPRPPYLADVPDYGHWIVKFKYGSNAPKEAAATPGAPPAPAPDPMPEDSPATIETIKTGDLRGVTLTLGDGTTKQFTCQGDWVLCSNPKGAQLTIASPTSLPYTYYTAGFIFLDGVKADPSTFRGAELRNGALAFHYKSGDVDVWIDPATMLPVAAKQSGVEISYQFLTPPPAPFDIPKDQKSLLTKERQAYKTTSSMR